MKRYVRSTEEIVNDFKIMVIVCSTDVVSYLRI